MVEERKGRVSYVIGPDGSPLTLADLPPPGTRRWVIRRKAEVVAAVRGGLLSLDDACKRYESYGWFVQWLDDGADHPKIRAAIDRADRNMAAAVDHHRNAESAAERSEAAQRQAARRENPVVMGRKVERLEAEERSLKRILATATSDYADRMRERLAVVEEELRFLRQAIQDSGVRQYTQADFQKGDLARIRGRWHVVAKANAKTIAVETGYSWTDKYPYHEVTEQRSAADAARHADAA